MNKAIISEVTKLAIEQIAVHYNTTVENVKLAIANNIGSVKSEVINLTKATLLTL